MTPPMKADDFSWARSIWLQERTRDAIAALTVMCERSLENNNKIYVCCVDFEKAFDRINWVKLMAILADIVVDWRERNLKGI